MKVIFLAIVTLASSAGFAQTGDIEGKILRTAQTPNVVRVSQTVTLYHTVCESSEVYGPDASCGSYNTCNTDSDGNEWCTTHYNSCYHTQTTCWREAYGNQPVSFDFVFDGRSPLTGNQTEEIEYEIDVKYGKVDVESEIDSDFYKYTIPQTYFLPNQVGQIPVTMKKPKN